MDSGTIEPKKYKVGYISGVFDLFHIGHVNLFRRAKEQCNYLIVGVVTDEQVISSKKTRPHIPFDQRKAVVESCRYVDEAVRIPPEAPGPEEAYMRYHFDAQFSGSDYVDDPYWLACQKWLRERGADLVFFPYTEETSSSKIKEELRK
ncbi:MAG: adenylyltransferase/cytidyltransferase family protein [Butyrivibrio sp.]|nr:adenylyltransferase/cytidyltransferase family protein [Butyrivibrio sp.]